MKELTDNINQVALDLQSIHVTSKYAYDEILIYLSKQMIEHEFRNRSYQSMCKPAPDLLDLKGINFKSLEQLELDQLRNQVIKADLD